MFLKKMMIIIMSVVIAFVGVFIVPQKKAEAFPLAIPAGVTLGAGVYTLSALGLAAIIGPNNPEAEKAIKENALTVWSNANSLSAGMIDGSLNLAQGMGNALVSFESDFIGWLAPQIDNLALGNANAVFETSHTQYIEQNFVITNGFTEDLNATAGFDMENKGNVPLCTKDRCTTDRWAMYLLHQGNNSLVIRHMGNVITVSPTKHGLSKEFLRSMMGGLNMSSAVALFNAVGGYSLEVPHYGDLAAETNAAVSSYKEAWESMRDAGLVLPVDGVTGYVGNNVVRYDGQSDTYRDDAGTVYAPNDVTWSFPQPRVRTGEEVAVPGVYVDTPALTGNPAIDETIIGNPAIPKTTTNVNTGVTIANPDYATDVPGTGGGGTPGSGEWNRPPTKKPPNISGLVVTKFPFSLPWDLFGLIGWLQAEPKAPVFKLDSSMDNPFGQDMRFKTEFTLEFLDDYIGFFRSFILIGFSLFLILSTRKLLGGGS